MTSTGAEFNAEIDLFQNAKSISKSCIKETTMNAESLGEYRTYLY